MHVVALVAPLCTCRCVCILSVCTFYRLVCVAFEKNSVFCFVFFAPLLEPNYCAATQLCFAVRLLQTAERGPWPRVWTWNWRM